MRRMRTLLLGILAVLVLWGVVGIYFGNRHHYPYFGKIVGVHKALGHCVLTIQRDGVRMEKELRFVSRWCEEIEAGMKVEVVSNAGWSVSIPSLLP